MQGEILELLPAVAWVWELPSATAFGFFFFNLFIFSPFLLILLKSPGKISRKTN